jgi:hypothetical protein
MRFDQEFFLKKMHSVPGALGHKAFVVNIQQAIFFPLSF